MVRSSQHSGVRPRLETGVGDGDSLRIWVRRAVFDQRHMEAVGDPFDAALHQQSTYALPPCVSVHGEPAEFADQVGVGTDMQQYRGRSDDLLRRRILRNQ